MRIALYQGKSLISRAIRWQSRSKYSHAAFLLDNGSVIEAWTDGVREVHPAPHASPETCHISALSAQHTPGTPVDIFAFCDPLSKLDNEMLESSARKAIGTPYDYFGIICFLTREKDPDRGKLFCSELVFSRCAKISRLLLQRISPSCVSPGHIALSPLIYLEQHIVTV